MSGGHIASASYDKSIKIWDPHRACLLKSLEGHTSYVLTLIDLGNDILASGSIDGTIIVWNAVSGDIIHVLDSHIDRIYCLVFVASKELIVSGSSDKTVRVWKVIYFNLIFIYFGYMNCLC